MADLKVPFLDMQARLRPIREELIASYERILDSGIFVMGPEARALEEEIAARCGVQYGVAVANGTAALQLALMALDIGPGDEVITVSNTFIATVEAISAVGATPVLIDHEPDTYLMDVSRLAAAITPRTRAIIPVHLYGLMCDMDAINALARRHGIAVIEDACQAIGATYHGAPAGGMSDAGCFSFYPGKNIGSTGEGGMLVTNRPDIAEKARLLRSHGEARRYYSAVPGWNLRLSEVLAAAVRIQLRYLDAWSEGRRRVASWYAEALRGLPLQLPCTPAGREHVYHLYVVQVDERDAVKAALEARGIGTSIHYPVPVHRQDAYASLSMAAGSLPVTEAAAPRLLSLPMFPEMTREQVQYVAGSLTEVLEAVRQHVPA
jgi:dTDP-4-amino-4,6-dideoxygalactose transaminase